MDDQEAEDNQLSKQLRIHIHFLYLSQFLTLTLSTEEGGTL